MSNKRIAMIVGVVIAIVVAVNLLVAGLDDAVGGNEPGGAPSSSYATAADGLAAYHELLARFDHRVTRLRGQLADADIRPGQTLVIVDPGPLSDDDLDAIEDALANGSRVVLAGASTTDARRLVEGAPGFADGSTEYRAVAGALGKVEVIESSSARAFDGAGSMQPLARDGDTVLAVAADTGNGELILLADASPLENALLAEADNAAFGLELAGEGHDVAFAEGFHGVGSATGLDALPSSWKLALFGLGLGGVLFAWASARRVGPPDRPHRTLPPARAEYVAALATSLERTKDPAAALDDLARATRERVEAEHIELSAEEANALSNPPKTAGDVVTVGRVAARVTRGELDERNTL